MDSRVRSLADGFAEKDLGIACAYPVEFAGIELAAAGAAAAHKPPALKQTLKPGPQGVGRGFGL